MSSNPDDLVRRQPVAEILVIDSSGSMGACHCNMGAATEGGVVKTDIARAGAELAIEALTDSRSGGGVDVHLRHRLGDPARPPVDDRRPCRRPGRHHPQRRHRDLQRSGGRSGRAGRCARGTAPHRPLHRRVGSERRQPPSHGSRDRRPGCDPLGARDRRRSRNGACSGWPSWAGAASTRAPISSRSPRSSSRRR